MSDIDTVWPIESWAEDDLRSIFSDHEVWEKYKGLPDKIYVVCWGMGCLGIFIVRADALACRRAFREEAPDCRVWIAVYEFAKTQFGSKKPGTPG